MQKTETVFQKFFTFSAIFCKKARKTPFCQILLEFAQNFSHLVQDISIKPVKSDCYNLSGKKGG